MTDRNRRKYTAKQMNKIFSSFEFIPTTNKLIQTEFKIERFRNFAFVNRKVVKFNKEGKPYKVFGIRKKDGLRVFIGNENTLY